jgi:hypothetical protein
MVNASDPVNHLTFYKIDHTKGYAAAWICANVTSLFQVPSDCRPEVSGCEAAPSSPANWYLARIEYDQAVTELLEAMKRYSGLPLADQEKWELLRDVRQRERDALSRYKQLVEAAL